MSNRHNVGAKQLISTPTPPLKHFPHTASIVANLNLIRWAKPRMPPTQQRTKTKHAVTRAGSELFNFAANPILIRLAKTWNCFKTKATQQKSTNSSKLCFKINYQTKFPKRIVTQVGPDLFHYICSWQQLAKRVTPSQRNNQNAPRNVYVCFGQICCFLAPDDVTSPSVTPTLRITWMLARNDPLAATTNLHS